MTDLENYNRLKQLVDSAFDDYTDAIVIGAKGEDVMCAAKGSGTSTMLVPMLVQTLAVCGAELCPTKEDAIALVQQAVAPVLLSGVLTILEAREEEFNE